MPFTLCLITKPDYFRVPNYLSFIEKAILGGVTSVQFRDKTSLFSEKYAFAKSLKSLLSAYDIPLMINDDVALAKAVDADGIHLGQSDVDPKSALQQLGQHKYLGLSIETLQQLEAANSIEGIDYIAASAVFPSITKQDCKTIWGLDGLKSVCNASRYPVMAIGGITLENLPLVMAQGACGIASISALHDIDYPTSTAEKCMTIMNQGVSDV